MVQSQEIWKHIRYYLEEGLSLIPVRDQDEQVRDKTYAAKTPYSGWTEYQRTRMTGDFLFNEMEQWRTNAIGIVCGAISGNLEVIDIDVKNLPGIDALILSDLQSLFPELLSKLRRHITRSGGQHIIYKIKDMQPEGNHKISGRPTTETEKSAYLFDHPNTKKQLEEVYFIETRGQGGYIVAPPSLGYSIVDDVPIPVITREEREALFNICRNYNQILKEPKTYTPSKHEIDYYDENPFNHFSRTADPVVVLTDLGWTFVKDKSKFIWFTRPDGTKNNVHGSFNKETRIFHSFTTNTQLSADRGYFLATIVIDLKFNGDKKQMYQYLVQNGYGKVNKRIEDRAIKIKANAGDEIPANFSEDAKIAYAQYSEHLKEMHPYGTFWDLDEFENVFISRERFYNVSAELGFRYYEKKTWQVKGSFIYEKDLREYYDLMKSYIKVEEDDLYEDICNAYEAFIQKNGDFSITRLKMLMENEILRDTRDVCYKYYKDCYVIITKEEITKEPYDTLTKLIFAEKIQDRPFRFGKTGKYIEFLNYATELNMHYDYISKIVGYLCHEFKDETMAYIIVLTEKCVDPRFGGGSGKNIWCELLKYTTTYVSKPAKQTKYDEKFFQSWNGQRIFAISDLTKDFDFEFLKEPSSGTGIIKKLFKDEVIFPVYKMPKFVCQTQFSFEIKDGGLKRRIVAVEFTDHFTKEGGVDVFFNAHFPNDWTDEDWAGYDGFITSSIQLWLRGGLKLKNKELSDTGWTKQFHMTYGETIPLIIETYWSKWTRIGEVSTEEFKKDLETYYFENSTPINYRPSPNKMNKALEDYARHENVQFEKDYVGTLGKCRKFVVHDDVPF